MWGKKIILFLFILPSSLLYLRNSFPFQETNPTGDSTTYSVKFIKSISSVKDISGEESFAEKIFDWIFGDEEEFLLRPMSMCLVNKKLIVLDQGGGNIALIDTLDKDFEILKYDDDTLFPSLVSSANFKNGKVCFTDSKLNKVFIFDENNEDLSEFKTNSYNFLQPTGIAFNKQTNEIWVVETKKHSISVFDLKGNFKRSIGKRGTSEGEFNFPTYIWIDDKGIVYVVDSSNFRIQILNSNGDVINVFGEPGDATGYFARPKGIAVDSFGHIFIVDGLYNSVQVFDSEGKFLYYFGTKGSRNGEFWLPAGIFIDEKNFIYIADSYNSRIQIFQLVKNEN